MVHHAMHLAHPIGTVRYSQKRIAYRRSVWHDATEHSYSVTPGLFLFRLFGGGRIACARLENLSDGDRERVIPQSKEDISR
jgi:hypothetical protein